MKTQTPEEVFQEVWHSHFGNTKKVQNEKIVAIAMKRYALSLLPSEEEIKKWMEDNNYQNSGLRINQHHRIDLYLSDVLCDFKQQILNKLNT